MCHTHIRIYAALIEQLTHISKSKVGLTHITEILINHTRKNYTLGLLRYSHKPGKEIPIDKAPTINDAFKKFVTKTSTSSGS